LRKEEVVSYLRYNPDIRQVLRSRLLQIC